MDFPPDWRSALDIRRARTDLPRFCEAALANYRTALGPLPAPARELAMTMPYAAVLATTQYYTEPAFITVAAFLLLLTFFAFRKVRFLLGSSQ